MVMLTEFDLTGKVAVVTGAGTGIGRATAILLAKRGADVAICGRRPEKLEEACARIRETGRRALAVPTDVRKPEQAKTLMEKVTAEFGRIDILINNAGGAHGHVALAKMDPAKWDRDVSLNLNSAMYCSQAALPFLRESKGCVVNISSMAGVGGTAGVGAYSAAKAGLQMLTRVASSEWGGYGVRVNCIACGMIATEAAREGWEKSGFDAAKIAQTAFGLGRYGEMDEAAQAIVFMASPAASYVSGETLVVGGGPKLGGMVSLD
jgi:NAD(P)-dependent dehydrogenase (short-subunit alcohol dehydrogenase family)